MQDYNNKLSVNELWHRSIINLHPNVLSRLLNTMSFISDSEKLPVAETRTNADLRNHLSVSAVQHQEDRNSIALTGTSKEI